MSVENQIYEVFGTGNGSATVFSFSPMVLPDDSSQLVVTKVASDGTLTLLVEGVGAANYSVALLADAPSTGSVTYPATGATRLAVGERLHMQRVLTLEQKTELEDQGGYNPETQEAQFDRFVMIDLQQQEQLDRAPLVPIGSTVTVEELTDDLIALAAIADDISTVAANDANVTTVAGIDSDITTVAGIAAGVTAVAAIDSDVTQVSTIHANVTTVAGDHSSVVTVASDHAYLATVASDHAYLATVAGDHAAIAAIDADLTKINGVYDDLTKINGVYDDLTKINGVYDDLTAIDSAYTNLAAITAAPTQAANAAASASAASTSAGNALTYSNLAASILASAPLRDQVNYTSSDSPITIGATHNGKWVLIDTSGGNVTVNMTAIAVLGEPFDVQITSKAGSNTITINRGSTDVFYVSGGSATTVSITSAGTGGIFSADATPVVADEWDVALIGYSPVTAGTGISVSAAVVSADIADQATAEAGTSTTKLLNVLRGAQLIAVKIGVTLQAYSAKLTSLAGLTWAADKMFYATDASTAALLTTTAYGRALLALADQAALQTAVGAASNSQTFNASGTWMKPASGTVALIECWGGGGAGGRRSSATSFTSGGGGGGGAYTSMEIPLSVLGSTETVTIGAGGPAITVDLTNGTAGGTTTFGSWLAAYGGGGGSAGATSSGGGGGGGVAAVGTSATTADGGAGGTPSGGTGGVASTSLPTISFQGGGGGGAGQEHAGSTSFADPGATSVYGGGGGGGGHQSGAGGAGGASTRGGGGGGGAADGGQTAGAGGTSVAGGAGGAGATGSNAATAGTQPAGGGGGSQSGNSGKGGDGKVRVTVW